MIFRVRQVFKQSTKETRANPQPHQYRVETEELLTLDEAAELAAFLNVKATPVKY